MAGPAISHTVRKHTRSAGRLPRRCRHRSTSAVAAGETVHPERRNHDDESCLFHSFVSPAGTRAGEDLVNGPRTTSITGVPNFPGLS